MSRRKRREREIARRARARRRARRMPRPGPRSAVLHALTSSALALPGLAGRASAESAPLDVRADYRFSRYVEDDIPRSKVTTGGETSRYEIDVHQFLVEAPLGERFGLGVEVAHETMSGATPIYVQEEAGTGRLVQVMTGPTVDEARTDVLLTGDYYLENGAASLSGGVSVENDYLALNLGVAGERQYNEENTTLSAGLGGSYDRIEPTGGGTEFRPVKENRQNLNLFAGISQILGRSSIVQSSLKYQYDWGFLSDPYKQVFVVSAAGPLADARPDQRHRFTWLTRYRKHWGRVDGTLHLDYQLYLDSWNLNSHTLELAWYQTFWDRFRLIPSLRYYSQSQADFYAPVFDTARSERSSDYRLSPFGALSWKIKAETRLQLWSTVWDLNVAWERYKSDGDLALGSVSVENPGLVSYNLFSVGLTGRF